jgi:hypothetical protein
MNLLADSAIQNDRHGIFGESERGNRPTKSADRRFLHSLDPKRIYTIRTNLRLRLAEGQKTCGSNLAPTFTVISVATWRLSVCNGFGDMKDRIAKVPCTTRPCE